MSTDTEKTRILQDSLSIMMGIGMIVNILANYVLMVIFDFSVKGAAWGTNFAMLVYVLLFFWYRQKG